MDAILPSTPLNYKQLIKTSLKIYRSTLFSELLLATLLAIIVFTPRILSTVVGQNIFLNLSPFSPVRLSLLAINLISMVLFVAILWRIQCYINGKHEPLTQDLAKGLKKLFYVLIATIIQGAIVFATFLAMLGLSVAFHINALFASHQLLFALMVALIFAGQLFIMIYVYTLFVFFVPLIAVKNKNIFTSLEHSLVLSWNHWWRVFSTQITPWLCYFVVLMLLRYVFHVHLHIYFLSPTQNSLGVALGQILLFAVFVPWVASLLIVQLNDLELRKQVPVSA